MYGTVSGTARKVYNQLYRKTGLRRAQSVSVSPNADA